MTHVQAIPQDDLHVDKSILEQQEFRKVSISGHA